MCVVYVCGLCVWYTSIYVVYVCGMCMWSMCVVYEICVVYICMIYVWSIYYFEFIANLL
jgi:hypothetical protein